MGDYMMKTRDRLEEEFNQISSSDTWSRDTVEDMKNILKSIYYIDVICAMNSGDEYVPEYRNSYSQNNRGSGRSYNMWNGGGYSPINMNQRRSYRGGNSYGNGYGNGGGNNGMSGRRYYDQEKDNAVQKLQQMMETENNEELRNAIQHVIEELG